MTKLPEAFARNMQALIGESETIELLQALEREAPTSIRLSKHKPLADMAKGLRPVPWCEQGYYLETRPVFTGQAALHGGCYYVQEASSMLLWQAKAVLGDRPYTALDLCAAPGGKSTLLLDLLPEGSVLVSNEVVRHRANILAENLQKWGNPRSIVTNAMPETLGRLRGAFDLILVDAPCSGEGMFRKDLSARSEWSDASPIACAERQRSILADVWQALAPEGLIVYSTCTMNREENEDIVAYIIEELGAEPISLGEIGSGVWSSAFSPYPCYRMMPHRAEGEGLFLAVMRKVSDDESGAYKGKKSKKAKKGKAGAKTAVPSEAYSWLIDADSYTWEEQGELLMAYPKEIVELLSDLQAERVPIVTAGIAVATMKGKSLIPETALALSTAFDRSAFGGGVALEREQVIPYLSREAIQLPEGLSAGFYYVHHEGIPLGFIKHLGNRTNNLYPQEWRIRHGEKLKSL